LLLKREGHFDLSRNEFEKRERVQKKQPRGGLKHNCYGATQTGKLICSPIIPDIKWCTLNFEVLARSLKFNSRRSSKSSALRRKLALKKKKKKWLVFPKKKKIDNANSENGETYLQFNENQGFYSFIPLHLYFICVLILFSNLDFFDSFFVSLKFWSKVWLSNNSFFFLNFFSSKPHFVQVF